MEILLFLISFLIYLVLTPVLRRYAEKKQLFDIAEGDELKIHKKPISIFGGLAMLVAFIIGLLFFVIQNPNLICKIIAVIIGSLIIFLLGFWDDLKWKHISTIKPKAKLLLLILFPLITASILFSSGIKADFLPNIFLTLVLTFLYIFVFINGVNYQDGMDGLAGGLVLISLIGFILVSNMGFPGTGFLSVGLIFALLFALLGSVFAFLIFNLPPAKIFMGDSGAYFLGFILAIIAMSFSRPYNIWSILGPIFIVGIPIWDGIFTNIRRILKGKSILLGDRSHFYDRLLQKGYSTRKTLLISYFLQIISVTIGLLILNP